MSRRPYELIIFDWDGTLVDSIAAIVDCTLAACRTIAVQEPPRERIAEAIGLGLDESMRRFFPDTPVDARRLAEAYRQHWVQEFHATSQPFAASQGVLEELAAADYLLAVATAKSRRGLRRDFERTGLESYFHASRTADETLSKPHPLMVEEILDELGVQASAALLVGDTPHDLGMAENAGVDAVGLTSGAAPEAALRGYGAQAILAGVAELPGWLRERSARYAAS